MSGNGRCDDSETEIIPRLCEDPFIFYSRVMQDHPVMELSQLQAVYKKIEQARRELYYGFALLPSFLARVREAVVRVQGDPNKREAGVFQFYRKKTLRPDSCSLDKLVADFTAAHSAACELAAASRGAGENGESHLTAERRGELLATVHVAWAELLDAQFAIKFLDDCMKHVQGELGDAELLAEFEVREKRVRDLEEHIVHSNLRFIFYVMKGIRWKGILSPEEQYQAGVVGLIIAAHRFRYQHGFGFGSYALYWIRQAIKREITDQGQLVRLPVHLWSRFAAVSAARKVLENRGERPTAQRIAEVAELSREQVVGVRDLFKNSTPLSLDAPVHGEEDGTTLSERIPDHRPSLRELRERMLGDALGKALTRLTPREATVIRLYFGLGGEEPRTLEEIGSMIGLTRERVRQIEKMALCKLRHPSSTEPLQRVQGVLDMMEE